MSRGRGEGPDCFSGERPRLWIDPGWAAMGLEKPRTLFLFRLSKHNTEGRRVDTTTRDATKAKVVVVAPSTRRPVLEKLHPERTDHVSKPSGHFTC